MKPGILNLVSTLSISLLFAISQSIAQTPQRDSGPRTASIAGQVTIGGQPAPNVMVKIAEIDPRTGGERFGTIGGSTVKRPGSFSAITDADGRYRFAGLAAGNYRISAASRAYVLANQKSDIEPAKRVTLDDGDAQDNVDLALVRGGVITGRVTTSDGRPLIATNVALHAVKRQGGQPSYQSLADQNHEMFQTDDRGVYRIYGLAAGRYIVSAGGRVGPVENQTRNYRRTWFRDTASPKTATIVEVKEGAETTDVDIKLGDPMKTYEASGRLTDAHTGKPMPQANVWASGYEKGGDDAGGIRDWRTISAKTDGQGNFRLTGLPPGKYEVAFSDSGRDNEYYSDRTAFEIVDDNVGGLEVKVKRAATISGAAVIEGAVAPNLRARLFTSGAINVDIISVIQNGRSSSRGPITKIAPNGEFRVSVNERWDEGRKVYVYFVANQWEVKGVRVLRVERDGVEAPDGIEVKPGQQITGVRVVFTQASGVIRGRVNFTGALPENGEPVAIIAPAKEESASSHNNRTVEVSVDSKGRFAFEDLLPGEYEVRAYVRLSTGRNYTTTRQNLYSSVQRVVVTNTQETTVELTIDPGK